MSRALWLLGVLASSQVYSAPVEPSKADNVPVVEVAIPGSIELRFDPLQLDRLGVRVLGPLIPTGVRIFELAPVGEFRVELADGAPTGFQSGRFQSGALSIHDLRLRRADGERSPALRLIASGKHNLDLAAIDSQDRVWLRLGHAMRSPDPREGLRLVTSEVRIGPALADWLQRPVEGELFAGASLNLPLRGLPGASKNPFLDLAKSCAAPNWPGTPGFVADVRLTNIDRVDVQPGRCRNLTTVTQPLTACDGPGGDEGEVVIVPSATLRNRDAADAADIPWYTKFSGNFAPYSNDQHPFLIWNLYRMDADGGIVQIARSGLKHAFATANSGCSVEAVGCTFNGHILGRGCSDLYDASSNDCATFLGRRSDLIPARGLWGRCGSTHDPDCNGVESPRVGSDFCAPPNTSPAGDGYSFRLAARETAIDPAANPGARWFLDAWYVVRDDADIFNTMGYREIFPTFASSSWNVGAPSAFAAGSVLDRWLALAPGDAETRRSDVASVEGHVGLAARVRQLPDGRWRYDYAVMNFDFSRAVTDPATAEPNLRILRNLGLSAFELPLASGAVVDASEFRDGDASAADWPTSAAVDAWRWSAPIGATLDWGQLAFLSVTSTSAPGNGEMRLEVAESGDPASYTVSTLVPDGAQVFRNSFE